MRNKWARAGLAVIPLIAWSLTAHAEIIFPRDEIIDSATSWWSYPGNTLNAFIEINLENDAESSQKVVSCHYVNANQMKGFQDYIAFSTLPLIPTMDLIEKGNQFTFDLRGTGSYNNLVLQLIDYNNLTLTSNPISTQTSGWVTKTIPFAEFTGAGVQNFLWYQVKEIRICLQPVVGYSGSVVIDNLKITSQPVTDIIIDDCDQGGIGNSLSSYCDIQGNPALVEKYTQVAKPNEPGWCKMFAVNNVSEPSGFFEQIYYGGTRDNPQNYIDYSHLVFYAYLTATPTGAITVELKDVNANGEGHTVSVQDVLGHEIPVGAWTRIEIPLKNFYNYRYEPDKFIRMQALGTLTFFLPKNTLIWVDDFKLTHAKTPLVLDQMDESMGDSNWSKFVSSQNTLEVSSVPGNDQNALQLDYAFDITNSGEVGISRAFNLHILAHKANAFRIEYRIAPESLPLLFELKYLDLFNRSATGSFWVRSPNDGSWQTQVVYYSDMTYEHSPADPYRINYFQFALSRLTKFTGTVWIRKIETIFQTKPTDEPPFTWGYATPNPFLPIRGQAADFNLPSDLASGFTIRIFDINGKQVRKMTDNSRWDGKSDSGKYCEGGVYLFQIEAKGEIVTGQVVLIK